MLSFKLKVVLVAMIVCVCLNSCNQNKITGTYEAFWGETLWTIKIYSNNKFKYIIDEHAANTECKGIYFQRNDSLILVSSAPKEIFDTLKLKVIGDTCLVDLETGYDYRKNRKYPWSSDEWNLKTMKIVHEIKHRSYHYKRVDASGKVIARMDRYRLYYDDDYVKENTIFFHNDTLRSKEKRTYILRNDTLFNVGKDSIYPLLSAATKDCIGLLDPNTLVSPYHNAYCFLGKEDIVVDNKKFAEALKFRKYQPVIDGVETIIYLDSDYELIREEFVAGFMDYFRIDRTEKWY